MEACRKKEVAVGNAIKFEVPQGWPQPAYNFSSNPLTEEGFLLGKKLFYDGKLSKDGNHSCESCHQQVAAFGTYNHDLSHGYNNSHTIRNAPPLVNLAWQTEFGWDGATNKLESVYVNHINSPINMGENTTAVVEKLRTDPEYPRLFKNAFGDETINEDRMTKAISQFLLMIVSNNSKYDKVKRNEATFNISEQSGYEIFANKCGGCHKEPLFSDHSFRNIGIPFNTYTKDLGRMMVTNKNIDSLKFKTASLRNVQLTWPYMHDGTFPYLDNVLEHYRSQVVNGPTTDPFVKSKIPLSNFEIGQLKAFMYALSDSTILTNRKFSQ